MDPNQGGDDEQADADRHEADMAKALRAERAAWSTARSEPVHLPVPVPAPVAAKPKARRAVVEAPAPVAGVKKKPFGMSYAGVTPEQHIARMIALRHG